MRMRPLLLRVLAAVVAVVHVVAPGAASIIDARPAAMAASERSTVHFEEPGSPHAIAHQEHCVLCSVATQAWAEPVSPPQLLDEGDENWPSRADWIGHAADESTAQRRSRAPPA
ncbi:MAG: hypothetical protein IT359_12310 [Gemmatimonadaceae bacterium]|nr:hypothetical protein [Gemmatimonadaceae bacterium]